MKLKLLTMALVAGAFATGCDDDEGSGPEGEARARIVHIAPEAGEVDLLLDGGIIEEDLPYGTATDYEDVAAGNRNVEVRPTGTATAVITGTVPLSDGESHTLLVLGTSADLQVDAVEDDLSAPTDGDAKVRVIHGAPSAGPVDIYLTAPGADLALETPDFTSVEFAEVLAYTEVDPGDYEVRVTPAGSLTPVIEQEVSLGSGDIRTAIAIESEGGGAPFGALLLDDTN